MRVQKTAATFALVLFIVSAVPSFAAADRDRGRDAKERINPIERVVRTVRHIVVRALEEVSIPRP